VKVVEKRVFSVFRRRIKNLNTEKYKQRNGECFGAPEEKSNSNDLQIQCRKLLLDFYGSQLGTHGRLIIGFSVIVFTIVGIRNAFQRIAFYQSIILYIAIFLSMFGFLYLLFRHLTYGQLCGAVMFTTWKPELEKSSINDLVAEFSKEVDLNLRTYRSKIALRVPTGWFLYRDKQKWGATLCAVLSFSITFLLYVTIG
jgi:hypothetical protein